MSVTGPRIRLAEGFKLKSPDGGSHTLPPAAQLEEVKSRVRPILEELETLRRSTLQRIHSRALWMVPAGASVGFVLGLINPKSGSTAGAFIWAGAGALAGWGWAFTSLNNAYRRTYKTLIIPHLTACFGDLTYRPAVEPDLKRLVQLGLIPVFGKKRVEDEILGTYRGVRINIVEAKLETGGKNSSVVFNGLLAELAFPRPFSGLTVVAKDAGLVGNAMLGIARSAGLQRVRLEDPRFEDRYEVYSNDQVGARALLTPAVMERLLQLDSRTVGDPPRLVAEGGVLRVALGTGKKDDLFEPPSIRRQGGGTDMLIWISAEIETVLKLVDAVLELAPMAMPLGSPP